MYMTQFSNSSLKKQINSSQNCQICCPAHKVSSLSNILYICLDEDCTENPQIQLNRVLCSECIDQQKHAGHLILSLTKFDQLLSEYTEVSKQKCEKLIEKFQLLRDEINCQISSFQNTVLSVYSFNFQKNINIKNQRNNRIINKQIIRTMTNSSNISQWNDILKAHQRGYNRVQIMNSIFQFKEQIICEQIQNVSELLRQNIEQSHKNIEFTIMNKNLLFNPDDMHNFNVGLTLNRNILQAVQAIGNQIITSTQHNQQSINSVAITGCKLAFTQVPIRNQISRSFRLNQIKNKIMIGFTDQQSHDIIAEQYRYQNYEKLIYGISVSSDGQVIAYSKNNPPRLIPQIKIKKDDIIEMSIHIKQNEVSFIQYRYILQQFNEQEQIQEILPSIYISALGNVRKNGLVTLEIDPVDKNINNIYYPFVGVAKQGDQVQLIENIVLLRKQVGFHEKKNNIQSQDSDQQNRQLLNYLENKSIKLQIQDQV